MLERKGDRKTGSLEEFTTYGLLVAVLMMCVSGLVYALGPICKVIEFPDLTIYTLLLPGIAMEIYGIIGYVNNDRHKTYDWISSAALIYYPFTYLGFIIPLGLIVGVVMAIPIWFIKWLVTPTF